MTQNQLEICILDYLDFPGASDHGFTRKRMMVTAWDMENTLGHHREQGVSLRYVPRYAYLFIMKDGKIRGMIEILNRDGLLNENWLNDLKIQLQMLVVGAL